MAAAIAAFFRIKCGWVFICFFDRTFSCICCNCFTLSSSFLRFGSCNGRSYCSFFRIKCGWIFICFFYCAFSCMCCNSFTISGGFLSFSSRNGCSYRGFFRIKCGWISSVFSTALSVAFVATISPLSSCFFLLSLLLELQQQLLSSHLFRQFVTLLHLSQCLYLLAIVV